MSRCRADKSLKRHEIDGVAFPLGVYPVEEMKPRTGYTLHFEPADGTDGDWEEWPDRYVFDAFVSATRVEPLCRMLFSLLPGRVYPILDVLGQDEYREIDPFVAYDLVSQDRFLDAVRRFRDFFFEDGLVGFGAMSEEPFVYVFVDEHKIVTVRVEASLREKVESLMAAFDLTVVDEIAGADAATHEHRTVLDAPESQPDLLSVEEIVEELREDWGLIVNIDPESNIDDEENELGITAWRCIARHEPNDHPPASSSPAAPASPMPAGAGGAPSNAPASSQHAPANKGEEALDPDEALPDEAEEKVQTRSPAGKTGKGSRPRYAEVFLAAECLSAAERLLWEAMEKLTGEERSPDAVDVAVTMDRIRPETLALDLEAAGARRKSDPVPELDDPRVIFARWLD
jgi:hypothetical protein